MSGHLLQAGVDAPPEEEYAEGGLETFGLEDYADPDLSYATMFANKLALENDPNGAALLGVDSLTGGQQADDGRWDLQRPVIRWSMRLIGRELWAV